MLSRAYSLIEIKSIDEEQRILEGIATTPTPDRVGDVIESKGAKFSLPLPLLWQHRSDTPIGRVLLATVTDAGIRIRAQIEKNLLPEIDRAWALIQSGLVRGLSIGFKSLESEPLNPKDPFWGGQKVLKWEWLELSAVTIPANGEATIQTVKSVDAADLAAFGKWPRAVHLSGVSDLSRLKKPSRNAMKQTFAEQKTAYAAERTTKVAALNALMPEDGTSLDDAQQQEFDSLEKEIEAIDGHLARLVRLEKINATAAVEVKGHTPEVAAVSRNGGTPVITVRDNIPPGIGFTRSVMAKVCAHLDRRYVLDVAKEMWPHDQRLHAFFQQKAAVAAANTQSAIWAGNLVDQTNLLSEFVEFLRPMTIIGQFGANGIPSLTAVPFNIRVTGQTTGGEAWWVGEGAPKPVTSLEFNAQTLLWAKVATIAVITKEQARFSSPSTELLVRNALAGAIRDRLDIDFVDPAVAAVANVSPASITNGLTPLSSAGTSADNVRTDVQNLLEAFILDNVDPTNLVLIMPNTLALALSLMVNTLGQSEFPQMTLRGGTLLGIPVIASQHAANLSGAGNMVIAVNARDIWLADDGQVSVDMSTEASLQMLSDPTNNSRTATATTVVSMFQTNSIALLAERMINWAKRRTNAVVYMDDVNWGAIGSPS